MPNDIGIDYDTIMDEIYQLDISDNTLCPYFTSIYLAFINHKVKKTIS